MASTGDSGNGGNGGNGGGRSGSVGTNSSRAGSMSIDPPNHIPGIMRDLGGGLEARKLNTEIPHILPHERVFPIQIGSELFRLSGASISSDAPSYFSTYFQCQLKAAEAAGEEGAPVRTLYIDRDPITFRDISHHLQGYHVAPRDGAHFVKLFADAQFYSLPRLISQLYEESIFISIGHRDFQIPREVFSDPGNSPNYFSLGFAVFFSTPTEVFPGLNRDGLLRPPSIIPPSVPNRSADIFAELLHMLRGYPLHIKNEEHRAQLLRDCRYFHLKGLEQKLIRHQISFNLARGRQEIVLRLEDIRQSGISIVHDPGAVEIGSLSGWVNYARPYVDDKSYELVLETGDEACRIHLHTMRAEFFGDAKTRISRLFEVIATKLNLPTTQPLGLLMAKGGASSQPASPGNTPISEDQIRIVLNADSHVILDGKPYTGSTNEEGDIAASMASSMSMRGPDESPIGSEAGQPPRKRRRAEISYGSPSGLEESWIVKTGQWRLRILHTQNGGGNSYGKGNVVCVLVAAKLDCYSGEYGRNSQRGFLGS
ncbi:BTB/POZ domain-containing protein [Xylogone sp. PMI_703]|nr:BTB/POZ domain-containing protein [Xylogone sp. PMI_703]